MDLQPGHNRGLEWRWQRTATNRERRWVVWRLRKNVTNLIPSFATVFRSCSSEEQHNITTCSILFFPIFFFIFPYFSFRLRFRGVLLPKASPVLRVWSVSHRTSGVWLGPWPWSWVLPCFAMFWMGKNRDDMGWPCLARIETWISTYINTKHKSQILFEMFAGNLAMYGNVWAILWAVKLGKPCFWPQNILDSEAKQQEHCSWIQPDLCCKVLWLPRQPNLAEIVRRGFNGAHVAWCLPPCLLHNGHQEQDPKSRS